MTETADTTTVDNTVVDTDHDQPVGTDTSQEPTPNSEAARYRTQLRDEQAKHTATTERLTGYMRREAEAAVADLLDVPGDLFEIGGADLATFFDDGGALDEAELRAAAGALVEQRPRLAKPGRPPAQWGQTSGPERPVEREPGWGDVIGGR